MKDDFNSDGDIFHRNSERTPGKNLGNREQVIIFCQGEIVAVQFPAPLFWCRVSFQGRGKSFVQRNPLLCQRGFLSGTEHEEWRS